MSYKLIFEKSKEGREGVSPPPCDVPPPPQLPERYLRQSKLNLPCVSEVEIVRHHTNLSSTNMSVDTNFYPLGSCTMKYNPKINEQIAGLPAFNKIHPYQPEETIQGILEVLYELERILCEISGMDACTLQPAAGAHGELTSLLIIKKYLKERGDKNRNEIIIPDSAHGTNPASSSFCGFKIVQVKTNKTGTVDIDDLEKRLSENTAAMMLTNPNTLGIFEKDVLTISQLVHKAGAIMYMDGANINAFMGIARPGDFGIDIMHFNPHKTFSAPHGGGGPGAGPVAVKKFLEDYLVVPRIKFKNGMYFLDYNYPKSIGKVKCFYGNINVLIKTYVYLMMHGEEGLRKVSENAVLNANYLFSRLKPYFKVPYDVPCMHEFVISASPYLKKYGVRTLDIAKRLIDMGFHPPTIYFPIIIPEALMIEPTETENKETLDAFADALIQITKEIKEEPKKVLEAPQTRIVTRLDEVKASRKPILRAH
jgi:glycine dehydrogenase subunit 2